jgi:hypothetical protein
MADPKATNEVEIKAEGRFEADETYGRGVGEASRKSGKDR